MPEHINNEKAIEEIVNDFLSIGFTKDDVRDIYNTFCDKYDERRILEGTTIRRKYERKR
jgi:hypothetical protein